jgi:tetratricopeptide (TPR) repeat protein
LSRHLEYRVPNARNTSAATTSGNRAGVYHEQKDWERAIYFYLRALENDDQLPGIFYNLGICYTMNGDYDLARDAYRRAIALQPGNVDAKYNLALLYRENKDDTTAIRLLNEVIKSKPDYATAHYALGLIYSDSPTTYGQAKTHYEKFLTLAPNDRSASVIKQWIAAH